MFTGIIEEVGKMNRISRSGQAMLLTISAHTILQDVHLGDSIAVNGVCLTVVSYDSHSFTVDVMPETYRKTNLKDLRTGMPVNLERAMLAGGRFGGHIVQGHVDGTAILVSRTAEDNAVVFRFKPDDQDDLRYMIRGGSITVDGISLTLVDVTNAEFIVSIIPHTLAETVLQHKKPGDTINVECDILGKYVERLLQGSQGTGNSGRNGKSDRGSVTENFLTENGFM
ncbi:riboflavin synthase [Paenibacillus albiflavus]|uniref:Riboflavin synthase n=1 Tax=Paenibacillus albiflavus TaxID=2545760 RepID=A0A4R4ELV8_9BACL|nr:riboflavin synthase [Paenibacillus albiflavus]TCZ81266.1 riboflavin synthase [Paenibacillus albiflavus]